MLNNNISAVNQIRPPVLCFLALAKKNAAAVALGSIKTAKKSAASAKNIRIAIAARLEAQTPAQRTTQARKAAKARWSKKR